MLIGELATACGVTRETLRFYEQRGLIRAQRQGNGYRRYAPETVLLVRYIQTAQQLGFTLGEIGHALPALWAQQAPAQAVASVLQQKLADIDARIAQLSALRHDLAQRLASDCPLAASATDAADTQKR